MRRVIDRDKGLRQIFANVKAADGASVKVGVQSGDGELVDIAVWNEFGTSDGRVPARPFMRTASDTNRAAAGKLMVGLGARITSGSMRVDQALGTIGEWFQGRVQATIAASKSWAAPNAPSTVAKKGSTTPLIDTGRLRQSIRWVRDK